MATYEEFSRPEQACTAPTATVFQPTAESISQLAYFDVGPRLSDETRESAITRAARAMEHHMAEVATINARTPHVFSDFVDASASRWMADRARRLMEQLIAGRK